MKTYDGHYLCVVQRGESILLEADSLQIGCADAETLEHLQEDLENVLGMVKDAIGQCPAEEYIPPTDEKDLL